MALYKRVISAFLAAVLTISIIFWGSGFILGDEGSMEVFQDKSCTLPAQEDGDGHEAVLERNIEETMRMIEMSEIPDSCQLEVPIVYQEPELPTGCESVALTMLLMYEGFELEKTDIADEYLIYSETWDFADGYVGDPYSYEGAGCFPPILACTAECFLQENDSDLHAENISGRSLETLYHYVANGIPAAVWCTMYMTYDIWLSEDGFEQDGICYNWYENEHCAVLTGYDLENRTVTIHDPLEGIVLRDMDAFEYIFDAIGQFAMVIL